MLYPFCLAYALYIPHTYYSLTFDPVLTRRKGGLEVDLITT